MNLFDWLNNITYEKEYKLTKENEKSFSVYMINQVLSCDKDYCLITEFVNSPYLSPKQVYDFYFYFLPKKKKYIKYLAKKESIDENLELIMKHFQVNIEVAKQYLQILSKDDIKQIKEMYREGAK